VLTTSGTEQDVLRVYAEHVNAYVRKPLGFAALLEVFHSIEDFWLGSALSPPRMSAGEAAA